MFAKLILEYHRKRMSELGKELAEAAEHDAWTLSEHRWMHKESRISFWIPNGFRYFRLRSCDNLDEEALKEALNIHDKKVLWEFFKQHKQYAERQPAAIALNLLRLKRQNPAEK